MYLRDPVEDLREHVHVLDKTEDVISIHLDKKLRVAGTTLQCSPMLTSIKEGNIDCSILRTTMLPGTTLNLQLCILDCLLDTFNFSNNNATKLKSSAFVAYYRYIYAVPLNTSPVKREYLISIGYTILGFHPISISDFNIHQYYVVDDSAIEETDCQRHWKTRFV